ncbi:MAG TPA: DUF1080 domain-containing protein [Flavobacterium sp.]|uniref:3-keto-disaccharide hydrolase n=1 Tax=Flavobacterium sp. TaxID=239 RepID=UPI002F3FD02E
MKKTTAIIVSLFCMIASANAQKKTFANDTNLLTEKQKKEGWQLLFDGVSTIGWHTFNKTILGSAWKVDGGTLHLDSSKKEGWQTANGGDIVYDKIFENFDFKIEWKISKGGNSGIMFYVQEGKQYEYPWQTGIECQVADNQNNEDGKIDKCRAGDLYDLVSCNKDVAKPEGVWNQLEIISKNGKLRVFLNDVKVISTTIWDRNWKGLIDATKFKEMPGFGTFRTGKIALQDHGAAVWYRNIMIKKL